MPTLAVVFIGARSTRMGEVYQNVILELQITERLDCAALRVMEWKLMLELRELNEHPMGALWKL